MKKLKKFAALLLVGVMALALLTACGGGGSGEDAQAEASVMTAINGKRTAAAKLDNDAERKAVASQNIDYVVKHGFGPFSSDVRFNVDTDHIKDGKFGFTFVAKYDYKDTFLNKVLKEISEYVDTAHNASVKQDGDWTNIGVVVQSNNEQSYIGISIRIKGKK